MATKAALTPGILEEQIQARIASTSQHQETIDEEPKSEMNHSESNESNQQDANKKGTSDSKQSVQERSRSNSSRPSKTPSTDKPMSLKNLQEMVGFQFIIQHVQFQALTIFCSKEWITGKYEIIDVTLERDPNLGLGITVAGYVHKKGK